MVNRRRFLQSMPAVAAVGAIPPQARDDRPTSERPRITGIELHTVPVKRLLGEMDPAWGPQKFRVTTGGWSWIEVQTAGGESGIGPYSASGDTLDHLRAYLVGRDPFDMEQHVQYLNNMVRVSYGVHWGIDIALWDLIGKLCGQPLYKLWGGYKNRVPAYASTIEVGTPASRAADARRWISEGWTAAKLRLHAATMAEDIALVEAVRQAAGDQLEIMVDANQAQSITHWQPGVLWDYARALATARELERLHVYWLEEPLARYNWQDLAQLNRQTTIRLAGGEHNRGLHEFRDMLVQNVFDILQVEALTTSLTESLRVCQMAQAFNRWCAPHHGGGGLGFIAHLHLICALQNAPWVELFHDGINTAEVFQKMLVDPLRLDADGCIVCPDGPGLGVEVRTSA